ncbi:hypothetical protein DL764_009378 [Monosporascus ibericus]|uniref:Uncharacterized protein n=1 Tax=Monosporascus ibericus TaxID=155417 RepID=A0A4Q4SXE7_9PEZI|nr:hypothetical protein DL764_009378 [Monosporascus ibericus]
MPAKDLSNLPFPPQAAEVTGLDLEDSPSESIPFPVPNTTAADQTLSFMDYDHLVPVEVPVAYTPADAQPLTELKYGFTHGAFDGTAVDYIGPYVNPLWTVNGGIPIEQKPAGAGAMNTTPVAHTRVLTGQSFDSMAADTAPFWGVPLGNGDGDGDMYLATDRLEMEATYHPFNADAQVPVAGDVCYVGDQLFEIAEVTTETDNDHWNIAPDADLTPFYDDPVDLDTISSFDSQPATADEIDWDMYDELPPTSSPASSPSQGTSGQETPLMIIDLTESDTDDEPLMDMPKVQTAMAYKASWDFNDKPPYTRSTASGPSQVQIQVPVIDLTESDTDDEHFTEMPKAYIMLERGISGSYTSCDGWAS